MIPNESASDAAAALLAAAAAAAARKKEREAEARGLSPSMIALNTAAAEAAAKRRAREAQTLAAQTRVETTHTLRSVKEWSTPGAERPYPAPASSIPDAEADIPADTRTDDGLTSLDTVTSWIAESRPVAAVKSAFSTMLYALEEPVPSAARTASPGDSTDMSPAMEPDQPTKKLWYEDGVPLSYTQLAMIAVLFLVTVGWVGMAVAWVLAPMAGCLTLLLSYAGAITYREWHPPVSSYGS